ncbi:ead/Ea22-like family protein [Salmonella enterica]|nr:ead/Ea22-like family protein [Salmonella enterica]
MTALNKQALRQLATDAHELGIIKRYTKGIEANKRFAAIATPLTFLALLDELEYAEKRIAELEAREMSVHWPAPKDSTQGWKVDPEFISKVQGAIGYDEECQCWEGTPSMEMVEAVLIAAAGFKLDGRD